MKIKITGINDQSIAEIISDKIIIASERDALDILAECGYQGAPQIIIREHNLSPNFFELSTGLAGEILQKFSNYNIRLAIVGDFAKYDSKSLRDFIYESNKTGRINFVNSLEEARNIFSKS